MIKNARQYDITKAQLHRFEEALSRIIKAKNIAGQENVLLRALHVEALQSQIDEFKEEIQNYIIMSRIKVLESSLIKPNIDVKPTTKGINKRLGLQIQRYESTDFYSASTYRIFGDSQEWGEKFPLATPKVTQTLRRRRSLVKIFHLGKKALDIMPIGTNSR